MCSRHSLDLPTLVQWWRDHLGLCLYRQDLPSAPSSMLACDVPVVADTLLTSQWSTHSTFMCSSNKGSLGSGPEGVAQWWSMRKAKSSIWAPKREKLGFNVNRRAPASGHSIFLMGWKEAPFPITQHFANFLVKSMAITYCLLGR